MKQLPERLPRDDYPVLSQEEFYRRFPASAVVPTLTARRSRRWHRLTLAVGSLAAAVLVVVLLAPGTLTRSSADSPFGTVGEHRDKGRVPELAANPDEGLEQVRFLVLRDGDFVPIEDGAQLASQSLLRFYYDSSDSDYLYLFSVDDAGMVTTYYPEQRGFSIPIARGRNIPLPDGVMLDEYVGHERFFALFSKRPLAFLEVELAVTAELARLRQQGKGIAELERLPLDCRQATVHIVKR